MVTVPHVMKWLISNLLDKKKIMKEIIFITPSLDKPKTGGVMVLAQYYRYLERRGVKLRTIEIGSYLSHIRKKWNLLVRIRILGRFVQMFLLCIYLPYKKGIIVVDHYFVDKLMLYLFIQRIFIKSSIIIIVHHFDAYRSNMPHTLIKILIKFINQIYLNLANIIIAVSKYTRKEIMSLRINPTKIRLVYNASNRKNYNFEYFNRINTNGVNLLFVGHVFPRKGVKYLIEAIKYIEKYDIKLHIAGNTKKDPVYYQRIKDLVDSNNLNEKVIIYGRVSEEELNRLYSLTDIFVLPSLWEGFGIVLLEAMHFKLPIIASNVAAIPELVKDGFNGLLVPPGDPESLSMAVKKLIDNPEIRKEMGERGYKKAISYTWEKSCNRFYQIIKDFDNGK